MNAARRQIGAILLESGRITPDDVERVLEYQRQHGGFFGQALVTLGIVSRDELDWALANQLDIPYIFPNASAVDPESATLVSPGWALAHLAVPILRSGDTLTVVTAEPLDDHIIEELRATTGLDIEMALASALRIRQLIHAIYGGISQAAPLAQSTSFTELLTEAVDAGADAFGVSARRSHALGWYRAGTIRRFRLHDGWQILLNDAIAPAPKNTMEAGASGALHWSAVLHAPAQELAVDVHVLAGEGGTDYLLVPAQRLEPRPNARHLTLPDSIATELRILFRSGPARIAVVTPDDAFTRSLVPQLPRMFAGPDVRAVHLTDEMTGTAYSMRIEEDSTFIQSLHAFHFDVVTIDTKRTGNVLDSLMSIAPFCFIAGSAERNRLREHGISWILKASQATADSPGWELLPAGG